MSRRSSCRVPARIVGLACAIAFFPSSAARAQSPWTWSPESGWVNAKYAGTASARELAAQAKAQEDARDFLGASKTQERLANKHAESPAAADALFAAAENKYRAGELYAAYEGYVEYRARHGKDDHFPLMLHRCHEIGRALLLGKPVGTMGITWLSAEEKGEQILRSVVEDAPSAKLDDKDEVADDALFDLGSYYLREHRYDEAETMFERLRQQYPRSEWVQSQQATYMIGVAQLERAGHDPKKLGEAQRSFSKVEKAKQRDEGSKLGEESKKQVTKIAEDLAEKDFRTGEFYRRAARPRAARRYYEAVLSLYPDSAAAAKARAALASLGGS